jgi:hypothetical protein
MRVAGIRARFNITRQLVREWEVREEEVRG